MARIFKVFAGENEIGESALEHGDPPMGIVHGVFLPFAQYITFKQSTAPIENEPLMDRDQRRWEGLEVRTIEGKIIACSQGVIINEFGPIEDPASLEITCFGIDANLYNELFPHHVATYAKSF